MLAHKIKKELKHLLSHINLRGVLIMLNIKCLFKKITCIITLIIILSFSINTYSFANDDDLQIEEINTLVEDVTANVKEIPTINSRHAVIYDRTTRESTIWEKRK